MIFSSILSTEEVADEILEITQRYDFFSIQTFYVLIIIISAVLISSLTGHIYYKYLKKIVSQGHYSENATQVPHILYVVIVLLTLIVPFILIVRIYHIPTTLVIYAIGLIGALLGLALQDTARDFIMSLHIIGNSYYNVGDVIEYNGIKGQVLSITASCTKIKDIFTEAEMTISNRNIIEVVKLSNQYDIDIPLPYEVPVDVVFDTLREVSHQISENKYIDRCEFLGLQEYAESAILYRLRIFAHPEVMAKSKRTANYIIKYNFEQCGIEIPYNQLDVHMK